MRKKIIVANWKLNSNIKNISIFFKNLKLNISSYLKYNTVVIAPSTIYLERVYKKINNLNVFLGAQDVNLNKKGAFTGETSILMLKDVGVKYVIVGHSERRLFHNESNELIAKKFSLIKNSYLIPILCVGESKDEKRRNQTKEIIKNQLNTIFELLGEKAFINSIIAYEPIWAIGTGLSADPVYVESIHKFIKDYINHYSSNNLEEIIVQYGGSINSKNAQSFLQKPNIDGLLVGSASLDYKEFLEIIKISNDILCK
ncbi:triose-phosphate isomerase [Buchnera aphidicola]|uniref:Triosephosphate isomerase n=1 Tax=Buchnera aphidicola (Aphis gossypii) TaxID=98785 RepID=A0A5J6ZDS0_9GAMM|nr:triose-phosphate isomerase [Buchnera aphidicola]QFQ32135.1 triose-phosphate isomerase [Buchnera aphidicola (Aphis gossypii)]